MYYLCPIQFTAILMLQRFFQQYKGFLRHLKASYILNNLLNISRLRHNKNLYRKYGIHKPLVSPLSKKDFAKTDHSGDVPWLDKPDALEQLKHNQFFINLDKKLQDSVVQFVQDGYLILEGFYQDKEIDALNQEVATLLAEGKVGYNFTGRKVFNLWEMSELANKHFFRNPELLDLLSFLLGKRVIPFQSMNFTLGSEQRAHSDAIHMTTEPPGYLIASWTALEDISPGSGELEYYPGSHQIPFISTADYNSGNNYFTLGQDSNRHYENKIAEIIAEKGLEKKVFLPKRGDVLIWHSNLLHGGSAISKPGTTRKSMVCHYYAEDVICYHEMTQRPALMPKEL